MPRLDHFFMYNVVSVRNRSNTTLSPNPGGGGVTLGISGWGWPLGPWNP